MPLADGAVLSGDSKLYVKAELNYDVDSLPLTFYLSNSPNHDTTFNMTYIGGKIWHATLKNSKTLGLKSYDTANAKTLFPGTDTTSWGFVSLEVALPSILFEVDGEFTDTVFIRSDSMKVAGDPGACLRFYSDGEKQGVATDGLVDSAGYKYKSRWTANSNLPLSQQMKYYRQFPSGTMYRRWDNITDDCQVTFNHDSLYAIGGLLTMESKGKLKPVYTINDSLAKIDNSFKVVTDSITSSGDSIKTKRILIDEDPTNAMFSAGLETDQSRAIAWQEYAGWGDPIHCHNPYNPRWNHYWDDRINGADTCRDSKTPCENASDTLAKDTGIMQIFRTTWENTFLGISGVNHYPAVRIYAKWDSVAWNWKTNIADGRWIFEEAMPHVMTAQQQQFPDSCSFADCDSVPDTANQEDLANYGYHAGEGNMRRITSQKLWNGYINNPPDSSEIERANYIKWVRRYKYRGHLW